MVGREVYIWCKGGSEERGRQGNRKGERGERRQSERQLPIYDDSLKFAANLVCINRLPFVLQYLTHEFGKVVTTATDQLLCR